MSAYEHRPYEHLNPDQFKDIPVEEFKKFRSSDWGVPVGESLGHMEADYANHVNLGWEGHPGDIEHGGPRGYIDHLKADIAANGLRNPPMARVTDLPGGGYIGYLSDGHHRAHALMEMGDTVRVRDTSKDMNRKNR